jgi:hypothetical protein
MVIDKSKVREKLATLPIEQRREFKKRFDALSQEGKEQALTRFLGQTSPEPIKESPTLTDRFDQAAGTLIDNTSGIVGAASDIVLPNRSAERKAATGADIRGFADGVTAGIPRGIAEKFTGKDIDQGSVTGNIVGAIAGPGTAAKQVSKLIKGAGKGASLARGAVEGAVAGAGVPTDDIEDIKSRALNAGAGAGIGGALSSLANSLKALNQAAGKANSVEFAKKVRGNFFKARS